MKYANTTAEQRESITPYLRKRFDLIDNIFNYAQVKAYQQAQKAEIERLTKIYDRIMYFKDDMRKPKNRCLLTVRVLDEMRKLSERINKLKFDSELE